jgi:hypothetical protein
MKNEEPSMSWLQDLAAGFGSQFFILPWGQIVMTRAQELTAQATNISDSTQP